MRGRPLTAELAAQSEKNTAAVCDQPPQLDALARHIEAPHTGAGGSHRQATVMPDPWATHKRPSANEGETTTGASLEANRCVPTTCVFANKGTFAFTKGFREERLRSATRVQEAAALIDETLSFFVKATGKDETSMHQLTNQNRKELRRSREHWKTRAEEEERLQRRRRKRGGTSKDSQGSNGRRGRSSRRNSRISSETAEKRKIRRCKSGQVKCRGSSNKRSGDARPGRERERNRRIPTPNGAELGRSSGNQEPSSHRRSLRQGNELRRQGRRRARCTGLHDHEGHRARSNQGTRTGHSAHGCERIVRLMHAYLQRIQKPNTYDDVLHRVSAQV